MSRWPSDWGTPSPRAGDRLPSVRQLSSSERVSVSTVLQAYVHLESLGLIETRPQSGHYVRRRERSLPAEPQVSQHAALAMPVSVSALVARVYRAASDPRVVPLGAAYRRDGGRVDGEGRS